MARYSKHPLSMALASIPADYDLSKYQIVEVAGCGVLAKSHGGDEMRLGNGKWCGAPLVESNNTEVWLKNGTELTMFEFSDSLKEDAVPVIKLLQQKYNVIILSGDKELVVREVAQSLGISNYHANMSPVDKYNFIQKLESNGHKVLMVGDGLNDAPSISGATVSMSPSAAIDIAQKAADIVFQGDKLWPVDEAINTAILAHKLVKQNIAIAFVYNIIAIPAAMCGLVNPLIAALTMSSSSIIVMLNSFRINKKKCMS
jgi:Cu2+-exporting ATPase